MDNQSDTSVLRTNISNLRIEINFRIHSCSLIFRKKLQTSLVALDRSLRQVMREPLAHTDTRRDIMTNNYRRNSIFLIWVNVEVPRCSDKAPVME